MPSMWLADLTLDLLTVRVCFRKYLLILVRLEKKINTAPTNFVSCWQNQADELCKAQKFLALFWVSLLDAAGPSTSRWAAASEEAPRGRSSRAREGAECAGEIRWAVWSMWLLSTLPAVSTWTPWRVFPLEIFWFFDTQSVYCPS